MVMGQAEERAKRAANLQSRPSLFLARSSIQDSSATMLADSCQSGSMTEIPTQEIQTRWHTVHLGGTFSDFINPGRPVVSIIMDLRISSFHVKIK